MIELTDPAKTQIDDYFQGRNPPPSGFFLIPVAEVALHLPWLWMSLKIQMMHLMLRD